MQTSKPDWALSLHGGAGAVAGRDYAVTEKHMHGLARECEAMLADERSALDVVERALPNWKPVAFMSPAAGRHRIAPATSNSMPPSWTADPARLAPLQRCAISSALCR